MAKPKRSGAWVVAGNRGDANEIGYCTRCGQGLKLNLPQLLSVAIAAMQAFVKAHSNCQAGKERVTRV